MTINLQDARSDVTSQNGEDGVISAIFDVIGTSNKWCCEFGAWDGVVYSNTHSLLYDKDWSGVLIECDERKFLELKANIRTNQKIIALQAAVSIHPPNTLDNLLSKTDIPKDFDLLSIDIDNDDYLVWDSLHSYKPRVVVIEVNSDYPETKEMIPGIEGASIKSMVELGRRKGYELAIHTGNAIFVLNKYVSALGINGPWQERFDRSWVKND